MIYNRPEERLSGKKKKNVRERSKEGSLLQGRGARHEGKKMLPPESSSRRGELRGGKERGEFLLMITNR